MASLGDLAREGDWAALSARLANQVDHTDDVAEALMREADHELSEVRRHVLQDIGRAEYQAGSTLAVTAISGFLIAATLGLVVTRSITGPLATLGAGARALADGDFKHRVAMTGNNELAHLAAVFNRTASELDDL